MSRGEKSISVQPDRGSRQFPYIVLATGKRIARVRDQDQATEVLMSTIRTMKRLPSSVAAIRALENSHLVEGTDWKRLPGAPGFDTEEEKE